MRCLRTEGTDRRRSEYRAAFLACEFKDIHQTVDLDMPGQLRLLFSYGREQGSEIVDCVDMVFLDDAEELFPVADVGFCRRSAF